MTTAEFLKKCEEDQALLDRELEQMTNEQKKSLVELAKKSSLVRQWDEEGLSPQLVEKKK